MARPAPGCVSPNIRGGVEGAIWDGQDLYTVTSYERIAPYLTTPHRRGARSDRGVPALRLARHLCRAISAIWRDDAQMSKAANGARAIPGRGARISKATFAPQLTQQIEISLIADSAFQSAEAADPTAAMLARLNIVEGIFSEQVGLLVLATDVRLMPANADPFTATKGVDVARTGGRVSRGQRRKCARADSRT